MTYRDTLPPYARAAFDHADALRAYNRAVDAEHMRTRRFPSRRKLSRHVVAMRAAQARMVAFASA